MTSWPKSHKTRPQKISLAALTALLLLGACDQDREKAAAKPPPPPQVTAYEVAAQDVPIVMPFSGTLKAVQKVEIVPRVSGYISEIYFDEGTKVKKGDPLYLIDPRPYQETLANYQAERDTQKASYEFWSGEVDRFSKLVKQGAVSQQQLDSARANQAKFKSLMKEEDAKIKGAQLDLEFTKVVAPFDGRVQQTRVNPGANVTEQQDILTEVIQLDPIQVIFNVTRTEAFEVQKLQAKDIAYALGDMVVELYLPDGSLYEQKGKIDFIGAEIDPTTDTVLARGSLPNTVSSKGVLDLLPGQYVPVQVTVGVMPKALVVPEAAVVETQEGDFVYVIGDDKKIERRKVELGRSHDHLRVVTSGLKAGEKLVMDGIQKVKAGLTVALQSPDKVKQ